MAFEKGNTVNLGRKVSEETRRKMRESHKGIKPSRWGAGFRKGNSPWNKGTNFSRNSYFAGLFDGEGSVLITSNTNVDGRYKKLCVTIAMRSDKAQPLPEGHKIWGGSLHIRKPRKSNHHEVLDWKLWTRDAEKFLISVKPFLRIKREQVEVALRYRLLQTRKRNGTNQISDVEWNDRKKLEDQMKSLNS